MGITLKQDDEVRKCASKGGLRNMRYIFWVLLLLTAILVAFATIDSTFLLLVFFVLAVICRILIIDIWWRKKMGFLTKMGLITSGCIFVVVVALALIIQELVHSKIFSLIILLITLVLLAGAGKL